MSRTLSTLAVFAVLAALPLAGCGGDSSSSAGGYGSQGTANTSPTAAPRQGGAAVVIASAVPELGRILVDSQGFTLYDFHKDKGTTSPCYGACAQTWPPLQTEGAPKAEAGAESSQLGTTKRRDGTMQVTYAGHPLYTYAADTQPGDATGNDIDSFGAEWYALLPSGAEAEG